MIASFLLFSTLAEKENKFGKTIGRSLGFHSQQWIDQSLIIVNVIYLFFCFFWVQWFSMEYAQ